MTKKNAAPKKIVKTVKRLSMVAKFKAALQKAGASKQFAKQVIEALKPVPVVKPMVLSPKEIVRIVNALQLHGRIVVAKGKGIKCFTLEGYAGTLANAKRLALSKKA